MAPCVVALSVLVAANPASGLEASLCTILKNDGVLVLPYAHMILVVRAVEGKQLVSPVLISTDASGAVQAIMQCRQGELWVDKTTQRPVLRLFRGNAVMMDGSRLSFQERAFEMAL